MEPADARVPSPAMKLLPLCCQRGALSLGLALWLPTVDGGVLVNSQASFQSLTITPAAGTVEVLSPWTASAFAEADGGSDFQTTEDGAVAVLASSALAAAAGAASSPSPGFAATSAALSIPGETPALSTATGRGSLGVRFQVTGGAGQVNVSFGADLEASVSATTDSSGVLAESEVIFLLLVDGDVVLFQNLLASVGANSTDSQTTSGALSGLLTLEYDRPYELLTELDAEALGVNVPEPTVLAWLYGCVGPWLGWRLVRRRDRCAHG